MAMPCAHSGAAITPVCDGQWAVIVCEKVQGVQIPSKQESLGLVVPRNPHDSANSNIDRIKFSVVWTGFGQCFHCG